MYPLPVRRLFATVCAIIAVTAWAQDETMYCYPPRSGLPGVRLVPPQDSLRLWADNIDGYKDTVVKATGSVNACRNGVTLNAEEVDYSIVDDSCEARGGIRINRYGDVITGTTLRYRFPSATGDLDRTTYSLARTPDRRFAPHGTADRVEFRGPEKEHLAGATYTTCKMDSEDWIMRTRDLDLDRRTQIGVAHNATVEFMGVPILYTPYISFPLNDQRKSGFLAPSFGTTGTSGFEVDLPWYWNIAPNMDDTFTPRLMSKRGLQLIDEFRYLEPKFSGELDGEILPNDREAGMTRDFVSWRHNQNLGGGVSMALNLQRASDINYFRDLSTRLNLAVQTQLPRDILFAYNTPNWAVTAREERFQTLYDPANPTTISHPYGLSPQVMAVGNWYDRQGADLNFTGELTGFVHPTLINGTRMILYPSVSYPIQSSAWFLTPKIGYNITAYRLGENNPTTIESAQRRLPIFSLDTGLYFDRDADIAGTRYQQTLEPRLYYVKIPFRDQTALPNFSTGLADFTFAQLFTENQFIGGDRINDADQVTTALTSRLIDPETGAELVRGAVGQRYYFQPETVTLNSSLQPGTVYAVPARTNRSDYLAGFAGQIARHWSIDALWQYSPANHRTEQDNITVRYRPEPGKTLNLGYSVRRDSPIPTQNIEEIDVSAQWPLTPNWYALVRYNYSLQDRRLVEGLAGFEYNQGCWTVRLVAHKFITSEQQVTSAFFVQLELNGLSKIGINPLETLRQNIPGYTKTDEVRR